MLCYRDRTFCTFYKECKIGEECSVALTDEVQEAADKWWKSFNSDHPTQIMIYGTKPECFIETNN
jgi:hypothetical protein